MYDKAFFDLQLDFAEAVAALAGIPLAQAVLDYTNIYVRLGLGRAFDSRHPIWIEYAAGLGGVEDPREWTYRFYARLSPLVTPPGVVATFGCFSYAWLDAERIRLHFHDADRDADSPLALDRRARRVAELGALVGSLRASTEAPVRVVGASWLYNLPAYRRLFPPAYLETARRLRGRFRNMPLWGQLLDRRGGVREPAAREFRDRLRRLSSAADLDACFALPVLALEAPADAFRDFYGV